MPQRKRPDNHEPVLSIWQQVEPKHVFTIFVLTALFGLIVLARDALGPYLIGIVLAYLVLPLANRILRLMPAEAEGRLGKHRETIATLSAFLFTMAFLVVLFVLLGTQIADEVTDLADDFPQYWTDLTEDGRIGDWYNENVPTDLQSYLNENVSDLGAKLLAASTALLEFGFEATGSIISAVAALVIVPVFGVYFLLGRPETPAWVRRSLPAAWADDTIEILRIADRSLGSYTRGVLITSFIVGLITGGGYWLIGVDLWLILGFIAFAGEVVPIIGPWIAFIISFPVILVTQPNLAIPALILFAVVQGLEGWFISPKIQGDSIDFSAAAILFLLGIGGAVGGAIGVVIALPLAAIIRSLIVYTMRRLEGVPPQLASVGLLTIERVELLDEAAEALSLPSP